MFKYLKKEMIYNLIIIICLYTGCNEGNNEEKNDNSINSSKRIRNIDAGIIQPSQTNEYKFRKLLHSKLNEKEKNLIKELIGSQEDEEAITSILSTVCPTIIVKTNKDVNTDEWINIKSHLIKILTNKWVWEEEWKKRKALYKEIDKISYEIEQLQKTQQLREDTEIEDLKAEQKERGVFKKLLPSTHWKDVKKVIKLIKKQAADIKELNKMNKEILNKTNLAKEIETPILENRDFLYMINEMSRINYVIEQMSKRLSKHRSSNPIYYQEYLTKCYTALENTHKKCLSPKNEREARLLALNGIAGLVKANDINLALQIAKLRLNHYYKSKNYNTKNYKQIINSLFQVWGIGFDLYMNKDKRVKRRGAQILISTQILIVSIIEKLNKKPHMELPFNKDHKFEEHYKVFFIMPKEEVKKIKNLDKKIYTSHIKEILNSKFAT